MISEIRVKELVPALIFSWRGEVRVSGVPAKMGEVYGRIFPYLMGQHVDVAGPPLAIYYEMPGGDKPMDMEVGVPVTGEVPPTDGLSTRALEGGTAVTTIYKGPYDEIGQVYDRVMDWVQRHGYETNGAPREIYLNGPDEVSDPSEYLTELTFPVRTKIT